MEGQRLSLPHMLTDHNHEQESGKGRKRSNVEIACMVWRNNRHAQTFTMP